MAERTSEYTYPYSYSDPVVFYPSLLLLLLPIVPFRSTRNELLTVQNRRIDPLSQMPDFYPGVRGSFT